jgi:hypothetical protein
MPGHTSHNEGFRVLKEFVCQAISDVPRSSSASVRLEIDWPGVDLESVAGELIAALPEPQRQKVALSMKLAPGKSVRPPNQTTVLLANLLDPGATLCPLLTALWEQIKRRKGESLLVNLSDRTQHELRAGNSPRQISQFAAKLAAAGSGRIVIS